MTENTTEGIPAGTMQDAYDGMIDRWQAGGSHTLMTEALHLTDARNSAANLAQHCYMVYDEKGYVDETFISLTSQLVHRLETLYWNALDMWADNENQDWEVASRPHWNKRMMEASYYDAYRENAGIDF